MAGRPLCAWVLSAACNAKCVDSVCVSTESEEIKAVVKRLGLPINIVDRPEELATDEASTESVMLHFMQCRPDVETLVTIQATSPLLESRHLDEAIERFFSEGYDSMLSAVRVKRFFWNEDCTPINYDPAKRPRRQEFSGVLMENGAFYITNRKILQGSGTRLAGRIGIYEMPENTAVEIDDPIDWGIVEALLEERERGR